MGQPNVAAPGLFCSRCGSTTAAGATICPHCGAPLAPVAGYAAAARYGGFWRRFVAIIIDGILVSIVLAPVRMLLIGPRLFNHLAELGGMNNPDPAHMMAALLPLFAAGMKVAAISIVVKWLYEALLTSSSRQATVGKMALGMKVTDLAGNRISFARATGRHFAKIISALILCIGYIMAAFTERKQALHDFMAGTLVRVE